MNRKQADGVWIGKKKNKKHTNRNRKHRQDKEEYTNWRTRQTVLYVLQMCKHAAHTTDDENSWIEYFFVQHEQGASLTFPALSAHVQDGRRGKVSAIAKKKNKKKNLATPPTVILPALPSLHQDTTLDSLPTPAFTAQENPVV